MKKSFILYYDQSEMINELSNDEAGKLLKHLYADDPPVNVNDRVIRLIYKSIMSTINRDRVKYNEVCEKNRINVNKRWHKKDTTVYDRIRPDTKHTDSDSDSDSDKDTPPTPPKPKKKKTKKKFVSPSKGEVIKYFQEKGYSKQAGGKAFDYYHEAGWKDARGNKVNNWKQKMISVWFKPENEDTSKTVDSFTEWIAPWEGEEQFDPTAEEG